MQMKVDKWNGYQIRFIYYQNEWWAVGIDICKALGLSDPQKTISRLPKDGVTNCRVTDSLNREQYTNIINEQNIYRLIFRSRKKEAEQFQDWVYNMLKELRKTTGLEGFQIFRMLDKEHQKEAMAKLKNSLRNPVKVDFIKANTIANKAVSNKYGYPKMVKKGDMTPDMLVTRQSVLEDTVELMKVKEKYNLDILIAEKIYEIHH